jgi:hypothetical protein
MLVWDNNAGTYLKRTRQICGLDSTGSIYSPVVSFVNKIYKEEEIIG